MPESHRLPGWHALQVGLLMTVALLLVLLTIFFAGGLGRLFSSTVPLIATFRDARGLRLGAPVWLAGIEVGSVRDIRFGPQSEIVVELEVRSEALTHLHAGAQAALIAQGLLGDRFVSLDTGDPEASLLQPGAVIQGTAPPELNDVVQKLLSAAERLDSLMAKLDGLVVELRQGDGSLPRLLRDPTLHQQLVDSTAELEQLLGRLNDGNGSLQKLIESPALYDNLEQATRQLAVILGSVRQGRGVAGDLVYDRQLSEQVGRSVEELQRTLLEARELLRAMRSDPKKYFNISIF